ncbi:MAG: DUF4012 domain-containing protein [Dehalococcoidia bacterium]
MPALFRPRTAWAAVVLIVVVVAGWHYFTLYQSFTGARSDLVRAKDRFSATGFDMSDQELAELTRDVNSARGNIDRAKAHLDWDPLVWALGRLPRADDQVKGARDMLDIAGVLTVVADDALSVAAKAIALRDAPPTGEPLTRSVLTLLEQTEPELARMEAGVNEAVRLRLELGDAQLAGPLGRARDRLDNDLPHLANAIESATDAQALVSGFLGFEGERHYLVLALNNGELMPGGGLVTAAGIMPVTNGVNGPIQFTDSTLWRGRALEIGVPYIPPPGPLQRYLLREYTWNLLVSNWNPDFPSWAQQAREFYELINGPQKIDGVIAVDLVVLERLMTFTGPKTLDAPGFGPITFTQDNVILELERVTRPAFAPVDDRKSLIGELAALLLSDLLALPSDRWADAVKTVQHLGNERHIQLLSYRPNEQTILRDIGWDGRVESPDGDYLMLNEASLHSTKLNLIIKPQGEYTVDLDAFGRARHRLQLEYYNSLPEWSVDRDADLIARLMEGGLYGGYLRVFGPPGIGDFAVQVDSAPASVEDIGEDAGKSWFGTYLPLPSGQRKVVTFTWTSPIRPAPESWDYALTIQKQPGTDGMCLAIAVTREGAAADAIELHGGSERDGRRCLTTDVSVLVRF